MSPLCRMLGHRPVFTTDGPRMHWACERCGGATGSKVYPTAADARRYAAAFNRRDSDDLGRRAPLLGLLPLRVWRRLRRG
ncbi:hypothetical protein [uncultured Mycolicibacterium sp.]|uniref:hypothetical protein n=1 Tax=uncultured Mycolicibacterium sp. TaxID=2320817 RepID=UPI00262FEE58|nr:hypothetical protein [uncultured Mycolicibacterium sp.]